MAEASISVAPDQFCCPVCLDLLKEPVALPCGHTYCMACITDSWNQDDEKGVYSCPQCRQAFTPRPVLSKNTILAEMVEKLGKTTLQQPAAAPAGPGDVECSVCTGRKRKAVKSCLMCMNSYCQVHLEQHENFFKDKKHHLMEATKRLQQMICKTHDRPLEVFCQTDQECICLMCTLDKHQKHKTRPAAAERTDKQKGCGFSQGEFLEENCVELEKVIMEVQCRATFHPRSAQAAVDYSERIFTELIHSIERRRSEVTQLIRAQEKAAVSQAEKLLKRLESSIDLLKRRDTELEQLSHTDDHIHFLQNFRPPVLLYVNVLDITVSSQLSFDNIGKSVSLLRGILEDFCKEEMERISARASCQLSLDPNTANTHLHLSQKNTVVTYTDKGQLCIAHPDTFKVSPQVLCRESVCGRAYWEVEWSGNCWVGISVSYKSIDRKGVEGEFGCNDQSWTLRNTNLDLLFTHNSAHSKIMAPLQSSRIGVYVDHSAGTLSFYSVSDTMTLLKRVKTTFTQPLYPGFTVLRGSSVKLCDLTT
uniref:E3 ubiquitin/ISG15 ligase TRIM25-like n=1 Tax=Sinocyclocheilus anshuiensis TaxID=1608454 RepID=A0A671LV36_9TELE